VSLNAEPGTGSSPTDGHSPVRYDTDLIVLGAGISGLAVAWRAARRGLRVTVLEAAGAVGGLAGSFEVAGMRVDYGSHRLHAGIDPGLLAELSGLLSDDLQARRRTSRVRAAGAWVELPASRKNLPSGLAGGLARDSALGTFRRVAGDSFADVMRARLGSTIYEAVHGPYAAKMWGVPGERIAGVQARRAIAAHTPWRSATRLAVGRAGDDIATYHYPRRGFGQIAEALAGAAAEAGATVRLRTEVESVQPLFGSVRVSTRDGSVLTARHSYSTIPLPRLARLTHPGPPLTAIEAAAKLRFRAMVLVYLVHVGGRWTPWDTHYLPGDDTPVMRISEPANYRDCPEDPEGRTVICAELPCAAFDPVWEAADDELAMLVEEAIDRSGLPRIKRAEVVVHRVASYYPVYEVGFEGALAALDAWARDIPSVTTLGRFGMHVHDNAHLALAMARDADAALDADGRFDRARWEKARLAAADHGLD
jgi:protoporphyrinogen oxidase